MFDLVNFFLYLSVSDFSKENFQYIIEGKNVYTIWSCESECRQYSHDEG